MMWSPGVFPQQNSSITGLNVTAVNAGVSCLNDLVLYLLVMICVFS